jgi:hypothetical protein
MLSSVTFVARSTAERAIEEEEHKRRKEKKKKKKVAIFLLSDAALNLQPDALLLQTSVLVGHRRRKRRKRGLRVALQQKLPGKVVCTAASPVLAES